jgi:ectoine hydroxylase
MDRINHVAIGDQTGADPERVAAALTRLELVDCELEPGSAVFFHCNTSTAPTRIGAPIRVGR